MTKIIRNMSRSNDESVKRAVQTLASEADVHSKVVNESVALAGYLTYIIRNEDEDREELEEIAADAAAFLDKKVEEGANPNLLAVVLWKNLLAIERNQQKSTKGAPKPEIR